MIELFSPPIDDHGPVPADLSLDIEALADDVVRNPGYEEKGRLTRRIVIGDETDTDDPLFALALMLSRDYLDSELAPGSMALVSVVTDAAAYEEHTRQSKAASYWHQDFSDTERGFYFPPEMRTRLIIPSKVGPICIRDQIQLPEGVTIGAVDGPEMPDRAAALLAGPVVYGADGVLMKSEVDPSGGKIYETPPDRVYVLPRQTVHKAPSALPEGRMFVQLDAFAEEL